MYDIEAKVIEAASIGMVPQDSRDRSGCNESKGGYAFAGDGYYAEGSVTGPGVSLDRLHRLADLFSTKNRAALSKGYRKRAWYARHQIDSYERFLEVQLPQIIKDTSPDLLTTVSEQKKIKCVHTIEQIYVQKPCIKEPDGTVHAVWPAECSARGLPYRNGVFLDIVREMYDLSEDIPRLTERVTNRSVLLGYFHCAVGSKYCNTYKCAELANKCPLDLGGFCIGQGNEKCIVSQEHMRTNYPIVMKEPASSKYAFRCEVRSCIENRMRSTSTLVILISGRRSACDHREVRVRLPFLMKIDIPLPWIYQLLGVGTVDEMKEHVLEWAVRDPKTGEPDPAVVEVLDDVLDVDLFRGASTETTIDDLCDHLAKRGQADTCHVREKRIKVVEHVLRNEFLPHVGQSRLGRVAYFSLAVHKLLCRAAGREPPHEQDHMSFKRVDLLGVLFSMQFRPNWLKSTLGAVDKYVRNALDKGLPISTPAAFHDSHISSAFRFAVSTGQWGPKKGASNHVGVAQTNNRMNLVSCQSSQRRFSQHISKDAKCAKPRDMHTSSWALYCPSEIPDAQCGTVNNLALASHISVGYDRTVWDDALGREPSLVPLERTTRELRRALTAVIVHGTIVGFCSDPEGLVLGLRRERAAGRLPRDISIAHFTLTRQVELYADSGCFYRPCIALDRGHLLEPVLRAAWVDSEAMWQAAMDTGAIDFLSKDEERFCRVASMANQLRRSQTEQPYTHLELDAMLLLGVCSSRIPFSNCNQSPRNTYGSSMSKQAIGVPSFSERSDGLSYVLHAPQRPLVQTRAEEGFTDAPAGCNVMLAMMLHLGYNIEDAVILNRSSIERGLFRYSVYRGHTETERTKVNDGARIEAVPHEVRRDRRGLKDANYDKLGPLGFVEPGTPVEPGDVLIGKTVHSEEISTRKRKTSPAGDVATHDKRFKKDDGDRATEEDAVVVTSRERDASLVLKGNERSVVDRVVETTTQDGARKVTVYTRSTRMPQSGDKFCSRHGQKGVTSIMLSQEDMPVIVSGPNKGMSPDIVTSPHGMPSRMTLGQNKEGLAGKVGAFEGRIMDGTPFTDISEDDLARRLAEYGLKPTCREMMLDPATGKIMEADVFFVPVHYNILRHIAADKIYSRGTGPVQSLTRQPTEGRKKDGGFKSGEMENCAMSAHGCAEVMCDRLLRHSDPEISAVCMTCGGLATDAHINDPDQRALCMNCRSREHTCRVKMPHAQHLLIQELATAGISMPLSISPEDQDSFVI